MEVNIQHYYVYAQDTLNMGHVLYYVRNHHGPDWGPYLTRAQADEMVAWYSKYY